MFVGGEFYADPRWLLPEPALPTAGMYFLAGGKACLIAIGDYLLAQSIQKILLPAYLCPSILNTLGRCGLEFDFYQVNEDFSIDLEDLGQKARDHRAVYFINYFGFLHAPAARNFFAELRQRGLLVVEDNAQAGFHSHPTGDFIFNSLRKFIPYDGGYLSTPAGVSLDLEKYQGRVNRRLPVIRSYREGLARYLFEREGSHTALEMLFRRAEAYYDEDWVVSGDVQEREHIERLDWARIKQARRENYEYLMSLIGEIPEITPIFSALQANQMPLGLPVYMGADLRNRVYEQLGQAGIGLLIHWDEIRSDPRTMDNPRAVAMASRILTLTIDQRTSHKQMDYLAMNLMRAIEAVKTAG